MIYKCQTTPLHKGKGLFCGLLVGDEWEESHKAGPLDRLSKRSLILGGQPRALARLDAATWIQEAPQVVDIFIIDEANVIRIEIVLFHSLL